MIPRTIRHWLSVRRVRRRFRTARQFTLDAFPEDTFGRISGNVHVSEAGPLIAPFSGRSCVYWAVEIVQRVVLHQQEEPTDSSVRREQGVPFLLEQSGARALVDPKDAVVSLAFDHVADPARLANENREQNEVIASFLPSRTDARVRISEIREAVIAPGNVVTVLGAGTREPDPQARSSTEGSLYRDAPRTRIRLTSSKQHPLLITDERGL
jgi:hypothetical protein